MRWRSVFAVRVYVSRAGNVPDAFTIPSADAASFVPPAAVDFSNASGFHSTGPPASCFDSHSA